AVVEAGVRERDDPGGGFRGLVLEELDDHRGVGVGGGGRDDRGVAWAGRGVAQDDLQAAVGAGGDRGDDVGVVGADGEGQGVVDVSVVAVERDLERSAAEDGDVGKNGQGRAGEKGAGLEG